MLYAPLHKDCFTLRFTKKFRARTYDHSSNRYKRRVPSRAQLMLLFDSKQLSMDTHQIINVRVPGGIKCFQCIDSKGFAEAKTLVTADALERHYRVHKKEKLPSSCSMCKNRFRSDVQKAIHSCTDELGQQAGQEAGQEAAGQEAGQEAGQA